MNERTHVDNLKKLSFAIAHCKEETFDLTPYKIDDIVVELVFQRLIRHPYINKLKLSQSTCSSLTPLGYGRLRDILSSNQCLKSVDVDSDGYSPLVHTVLMGSSNAKLHFLVSGEFVARQKNSSAVQRQLKQKTEETMSLLRKLVPLQGEQIERNQKGVLKFMEFESLKFDPHKDKNPEGSLASFSKFGDFANLYRYLAAGRNPNYFSRPGSFGCLALAAGHGQLENVKTLLAFGADPNLKLSIIFGIYNALYCVITSKSDDKYEIIKLLLFCGADPNSSSPQSTVLHAAIAAFDIKSVEMLVKAGADLFTGKYCDRLPLQYAKHLLSKNKPGDRDKSNLEEIVNYLETENKKLLGPPELINAAKTGNDNRVRELLYDGVSPHSNISGVTPLFAAAEQRQHNTVLLLLGSGLNVKEAMSQPPRYYSPFAAAIKNHDKYLVETFLKAGASPDTVSSHNSVLFTAIYKGDLPIVKKLVDAGASLDKTYNEKTPLQVAEHEHYLSPKNKGAKAVLIYLEDIHKQIESKAEKPKVNPDRKVKPHGSKSTVKKLPSKNKGLGAWMSGFGKRKPTSKVTRQQKGSTSSSTISNSSVTGGK